MGRLAGLATLTLCDQVRQGVAQCINATAFAFGHAGIAAASSMSVVQTQLGLAGPLVLAPPDGNQPTNRPPMLRCADDAQRGQRALHARPGPPAARSGGAPLPVVECWFILASLGLEALKLGASSR